MNRLGSCLLAAAMITACSKLPTTGDGIVVLEVITPATLTLYKDSTVTLQARALDQQGKEVTAVVRWFTVDTAAATVDSVLGRVTAKLGSGSARIQASVGSLHSVPLTLLLSTPPVTSLVLPQEH